MGSEKQIADDLQAFDISSLGWESVEVAGASITEIYTVVLAKATSIYDWYLTKRKQKKWLAQWLRAVSTLLVAAGTVIPLLSLVWSQIPSELGYIFFVAAGACLLINRTLGISSGWIRNVTTAFQVSSALERFQLRWAVASAKMGGKPTNAQEVEELLDILCDFTLVLNQLVEKETNVWATSFNQDLTQLEQLAQTPVRYGKTAAST